MDTISRADMLARIVASGEIPFRIAFVKGTGKEAGKITEKVCYYGSPNPEPRGKDAGHTHPSPGAAPVVRAQRKSHLESNSIPLTEFGTRKNLTPFISHIIKYNGKQVIH